MLRELTAYYRPKDLGEALSLFAGTNVVALAGGTELLARKDATIKAVVDLQDLGLDYVSAEDNGLHIGAMTRLQTLVTHQLTREFAGGLIARCAEQSAQFTERCSATLGGTVAAASANHDLLLALLVCDAHANFISQRPEQARLIVLSEFLNAERASMPKGLLLTEVVLPAQPSGARYAFERVSRTPRDRAIVNVAMRAALDGDVVRDVRVAVGAVAAHPIRLGAMEQLLDGRRIDEQLPAPSELLRDLTPPNDHIASSEYRRAMVGVLLRRCVRELSQ